MNLNVNQQALNKEGGAYNGNEISAYRFIIKDKVICYFKTIEELLNNDYEINY